MTGHANDYDRRKDRNVGGLSKIMLILKSVKFCNFIWWWIDFFVN